MRLGNWVIACVFFQVSSSLAAPPPRPRPLPPRYPYRRKAPPIISLYVSEEDRRDNALRLAAREGSEDALAPLVRSGARIDSRSGEGQTALMYAASSCRLDAAERLIELGAGVDLKDRKGRTALIHAVRSSCLPVVRTLLRMRARTDIVDGSGRTALRYARMRAVVEVDGPDTRIVRILSRQAGGLAKR